MDLAIDKHQAMTHRRVIKGETVAINKNQACRLSHNIHSIYFIVVCGRVPWLYQYWPGGFMLFVVLCPGTPEGSTGSGSGFKASQKTGQRLKVSSDDFSKMIINPYVTTVLIR